MQDSAFLDDCHISYNHGRNKMSANSLMLRSAYPFLSDMDVSGESVVLPTATASTVQVILAIAYTGRF